MSSNRCMYLLVTAQYQQDFAVWGPASGETVQRSGFGCEAAWRWGGAAGRPPWCCNSAPPHPAEAVPVRAGEPARGEGWGKVVFRGSWKYPLQRCDLCRNFFFEVE